MGAIETEAAARRLARVILSDIDLYIRERPKLGESREAQIEEGRRLFASRVAPELVPVFGLVLADRAAGRVNVPAAAAAAAAVAAPSIPASVAAATAAPVHSTPASSAATEDDLPTDPSIFVPPLEDQPPPAPALAARAVVQPPRVASRPATEDRPRPAPPIAARPPAEPRSAAPTPAVRSVAPAPPPAPVVAPARPEVPLRVPPAPPAVQAPAAVARARPVAPPAPVPPAPVPTARPSIPRLLAIVSVAAVIVAVLRLVFR